MKCLFEKEVEVRIGEREKNRRKRSYLLTGMSHTESNPVEETKLSIIKQDSGEGMKLESNSFTPKKISIINLHE